MTIKAAFFDIDGTLFSHKSGHVPPSTEKAIARLRENGIITAICTGRHDQEVRRVNLASLQFDYTITLNGQMIRDSEGRLVKAFPFKSDDIAAIEDLFKQKKIAIMAIEEDDIYLNAITEAAISANAAVSIPLPRVDTLKGKPLYQLICYGSKEEIESVTERLNAKAVWWNSKSVDVIPEYGGKDKGIEALLERLNISRDEIITFGDGMNDIPMLRLSPYSVAMGNAEEDVKNSASYVTTDIDDDGIYNALTHFNLI